MINPFVVVCDIPDGYSVIAQFILVIHDIQSEQGVTGLAVRSRPTGVVAN